MFGACVELIGGHYHTYVALIGANGDVCQDKHVSVTCDICLYVRWLCVMCRALCVMCSAFCVSGTCAGGVGLLVHRQQVLSAVVECV